MTKIYIEYAKLTMNSSNKLDLCCEQRPSLIGQAQSHGRALIGQFQSHGRAGGRLCGLAAMAAREDYLVREAEQAAPLSHQAVFMTPIRSKWTLQNVGVSGLIVFPWQQERNITCRRLRRGGGRLLGMSTVLGAG